MAVYGRPIKDASPNINGQKKITEKEEEEIKSQTIKLQFVNVL